MLADGHVEPLRLRSRRRWQLAGRQPRTTRPRSPLPWQEPQIYLRWGRRSASGWGVFVTAAAERACSSRLAWRPGGQLLDPDHRLNYHPCRLHHRVDDEQVGDLVEEKSKVIDAAPARRRSPHGLAPRLRPRRRCARPRPPQAHRGDLLRGQRRRAADRAATDTQYYSGRRRPVVEPDRYVPASSGSNQRSCSTRTTACCPGRVPPRRIQTAQRVRSS